MVSQSIVIKVAVNRRPRDFILSDVKESADDFVVSMLCYCNSVVSCSNAVVTMMQPQ